MALTAHNIPNGDNMGIDGYVAGQRFNAALLFSKVPLLLLSILVTIPRLRPCLISVVVIASLYPWVSSWIQYFALQIRSRETSRIYRSICHGLLKQVAFSLLFFFLGPPLGFWVRSVNRWYITQHPSRPPTLKLLLYWKYVEDWPCNQHCFMNIYISENYKNSRDRLYFLYGIYSLEWTPEVWRPELDTQKVTAAGRSKERGLNMTEAWHR